MAKYKEIPKSANNNELESRFRQIQSPEVVRTIEKLNNEYGKYVVSLAELRKTLDRELGKRTLTAELEAMREEP